MNITNEQPRPKIKRVTQAEMVKNIEQDIAVLKDSSNYGWSKRELRIKEAILEALKTKR